MTPLTVSPTMDIRVHGAQFASVGATLPSLCYICSIDLRALDIFLAPNIQIAHDCLRKRFSLYVETPMHLEKKLVEEPGNLGPLQGLATVSATEVISVGSM